jgi:hypothetical protein
MEDNLILDNDAPAEGLRISNQATADLREAARWARFLAIVNFVFLGLAGLGILTIGSFMGSSASSDPTGVTSAFGGVILFSYVVLLAIAFFPVLYLYRFGTLGRQAADHRSQPALNDALANIKAHYRFVGIIMLIGLAFYGFVLVLALFTGIGATLFG